MFSSILLKRNFDSVGSWHVRSLFLGMMHFQDKYAMRILKGFRDVTSIILLQTSESSHSVHSMSSQNGITTEFRRSIASQSKNGRRLTVRP